MKLERKIYINGLGNVSPQRTTDGSSFLADPVFQTTDRLACIEPNYRDFISPDLLRRMGRLIKMGIASSNLCLKDADCGMPDAIITGTGLGCMEDTEKFLSILVKNNEELLTPTSFIQSTHNTVSAQIALLLKCHAYNFTYVHRGWSFESALTDALLQISSGSAMNVLAGGMDEITRGSFEITKRLGHWRRTPADTSRLLTEKGKGSIAGEGSSFFLLSPEPAAGTYASLANLLAFDRRSLGIPLETVLSDFLKESGLNRSDIDVLVCGMNGDIKSDLRYTEITDFLGHSSVAAWKHLSGEYQTSSAFGLWLAAMIMKHQSVPSSTLLRAGEERPFRNILIYNHYLDLNHSFILIRKP